MRREITSKMRLIMLGFALFARIDGLWPRGLLAQQVVVEDLARDRARGRAAVLAVLDEDRHGDLRVVGGGEGDEERVVPVLALQVLLVVLLVLLHADHLRGAGL